MSEGLVEKLKYFIGINDDFDEDMELEEEFEPMEQPQSMEQPKVNKKHNNNVVNLHTSASMKIVVHEPQSYEEAPGIVNDLKMRKTVVVNLEQVDATVKRHIFDFINGGLYSLEGSIQKVTKDIFVLAPSNVEIDGIKDELKNKGIFSW